MVREDILYGLRNAVERGENINDAARTFINAGYDEKEVNDVAREIMAGGISERKFALPAIPTRKMEALPELPAPKKTEPLPKPEKPIPFTKIAEKPTPQKEMPILPLTSEAAPKKPVLSGMSNKTLIISIGVIGVLIIALTGYLVYLLMA